MEFQTPLCLLFLVLFCLLSSSQAHKFNVGGSDGWVPNPSENYNQWAGRNRFKVNDTLVFKYKKGSDSVLEVKKDDYDKCNTTKPIKKFEDGDTEFKFDRTGPFYFISGKEGNCEKGQKLVVVVLSSKSPSPTPSPVSQPPLTPPKPPSGSPASSPTTPSPSGSPPSPSVSPSPAGTPPSTSPSPAGIPPSTSPSPAGIPPSTSPSPAGIPPSTSPSPAGIPPSTSPSPASTPPVPSPGTAPVPATTPPSSSPSTAPLASPPPPPAETPTSPSPGPGQTPSSSNASAPPPSNGGLSAWAVTPSSFLVYSVTIVIGAALSNILGRN